jgi:hypothetical protein
MAISILSPEAPICQLIIDTDLDDSPNQELEEPAPRLCLWPGCLTLASTLRELESHAVHQHHCLPPRHRTRPWCEQLVLFDVSRYDGRFTSLFGRACL